LVSRTSGALSRMMPRSVISPSLVTLVRLGPSWPVYKAAVTPASSSRVVSSSVSRLAWSLASAFIGYKINALRPVSPARRARNTWSRIGYRNASVLPDPVPVVISVGHGRGRSGPNSAELNRANAAA